jgi:hypothetical protein
VVALAVEDARLLERPADRVLRDARELLPVPLREVERAAVGPEDAERDREVERREALRLRDEAALRVREVALRADVPLLLRAVERALPDCLLVDVRFREAVLARGADARVDAERRPLRGEPPFLVRELPLDVAERRPVRAELFFAVAREPERDAVERRRVRDELVRDDDDALRDLRERAPVREREALVARAAVPLRRLPRLLPSARASAVSRPISLLKLLFCPPVVLS